MIQEEVIRDDAYRASRIIYPTSRNLRVTCYTIYKKETLRKRRCIIYLRGGNRDFGANRPEDFTCRSYCVKFAKEGFFVIAPQYPGVDGGEGHDEFGGADDIDSIISLHNVLKNFEDVVDVTNVGIIGLSRGGASAYQVMRQNPPWLKTVIVMGAPVDEQMQWKHRPRMKKVSQELYGATKDGAEARSVMKWYKELPTRISLLVLQGSEDINVHPIPVLRFARRLTEIRYPHKFIMYGNGRHNLFIDTDAFSECTNWFWRHL